MTERHAEIDGDCTCEVYVVDYSDQERYHPENLDREEDPNCPFHGPSDRAQHPGAEPSRTVELARLAAERQDLIAQGVDPAALAVPLAPAPTD